MLKSLISTKILKKTQVDKCEKGEKETRNIKVYLRLRPLNELEMTLGGQVCVQSTKN